MASISSLGVGSGLDLSSIVSGLVEAERAPTDSRLDFKQETITTKLSAFGALKSSLSLFQGTLTDVQSSTTFNTKTATVTDDSVFSASVSTVADTGTYSIEVTDLAQSHALASSAATAFSNVDDVIGSGTMTIRFGTTTTGPYSFTQDTSKATEIITVSAANGNNTLSGLRDYINDNEFGVRASIINDGNGYRLTLTSEDSGAENSMEITVSGDGDGDDNDNSGLSQLAFNTNAQAGMIQTVAAQDAVLKVNGLEITRDTNTVTGAINGVTLNLSKADSGNVINLNIGEDSGAVFSAIEEFVEGYNGLTETINTLTKYDSETGESGLLIGDSTVRNVSSQLRNLMTNTVDQLAGSIRSFSDIGISTQFDGTLQIDAAKLNSAIASDTQAVEALFRPQGRPTDGDVEFVSSTDNTQPGAYSVLVSSFATQGVYNGATLNNLTIGNDNDAFTIKVDGTTSNSILLTQDTYADGDALATHIQAQINGDALLQAESITVSVSFNGTGLDITSARYGSESTIEFTSVDASMLADLGFGVGSSGADGTDISGTINGSAATGAGQMLTSNAGNSSGLALLIDSGSTGFRGTVSFSKGMISSINEILDSYLQSDGLISTREEGLTDDLEDINEQREKLDLRISGLEARLISQFATLDSLIAQFNNTSSFLTQQLANLPKPNSISRNN